MQEKNLQRYNIYRQFEHTEVFKTDVKQVFDFIKYSDDKEKLLALVENDVYYQQIRRENVYDFEVFMDIL